MSKLSRFLSSHKGKVFFNMAYSWGACLVILGAVFKISHFPYDDVFLMVGMITEVTVFFITGFDDPAREYKWERVFPTLLYKSKTGQPSFDTEKVIEELSTKAIKEKLKEMEAHIDAMNKAYEQQTAELASQMKAITEVSAAFNRMKEVYTDALSGSDAIRKDTNEISGKLDAINKQYSKMMEAMNIQPKH